MVYRLIISLKLISPRDVIYYYYINIICIYTHIVLQNIDHGLIDFFKTNLIQLFKYYTSYYGCQEH